MGHSDREVRCVKGQWDSFEILQLRVAGQPLPAITTGQKPGWCVVGRRGGPGRRGLGLRFLSTSVDEDATTMRTRPSFDASGRIRFHDHSVKRQIVDSNRLIPALLRPSRRARLTSWEVHPILLRLETNSAANVRDESILFLRVYCVMMEPSNLRTIDDTGQHTICWGWAGRAIIPVP